MNLRNGRRNNTNAFLNVINDSDSDLSIDIDTVLQPSSATIANRVSDTTLDQENIPFLVEDGSSALSFTNTVLVSTPVNLGMVAHIEEAESSNSSSTKDNGTHPQAISRVPPELPSRAPRPLPPKDDQVIEGGGEKEEWRLAPMDHNVSLCFETIQYESSADVEENLRRSILNRPKSSCPENDIVWGGYEVNHDAVFEDKNPFRFKISDDDRKRAYMYDLKELQGIDVSQMPNLQRLPDSGSWLQRQGYPDLRCSSGNDLSMKGSSSVQNCQELITNEKTANKYSVHSHRFRLDDQLIDVRIGLRNAHFEEIQKHSGSEPKCSGFFSEKVPKFFNRASKLFSNDVSRLESGESILKHWSVHEV
ncbi:hypothetical protein PUMCH_004734 [Australozyma saopauloensis]|uniref:Uncharacterized protein n=1 Tax=Australozyma saopauloensis TaxID=291208 RepID=A0AAX4HGA7_9ASCO|nr:hypothetical protein PUMCH_004734 [[Candida] saopauloensis]